MPEGEGAATQTELENYYHAVDSNPHDPGLWNELLSKAIAEEKGSLRTGVREISCNDLTQLHERILAAENPREKFEVLAQPAPDGKIWYEHVLGKTNRFGANFLLDFINAQDYGLVVDVGTGPGDSLVPTTPNRRVIGIDISKSLLHAAKQKNPTALIQADATKTPIKASSVDAMYSHGLTYHLSLSDVDKLAGETKRILKPGGHYLEAWSINEPGRIPESEEHLVKNYTSLLLLVLDRISTADAQGAMRPFEVWKKAFESKGFRTTMHRRGNEIVFQFQKPYSEDLETARSEYLSGDTEEAESAIQLYVFPQKYLHHVKGALVNLDALSLEQWNQRMLELQQFGKDERILQSTTEPGDYLGLCIYPLLPTIQGKQYSEDFRPAAVAALAHNVQVLIDKVINLGSPHWSHKHDRKLLTELRDDIGGNPLCDSIIQKINTALGENLNI